MGMTDERLRPRISLCMIVRDEEETLPDCLESVLRASKPGPDGLVDEVVIVDTGSTDGTIDVARSFGARVLQEPWRKDFSAARNVSLEAATGDWILWLDADERLAWSRDAAEFTARKRTLLDHLRASPCAAWFIPVVNRTPRGRYAIRGHRLFRRMPGLRFTGRVHEQLTPALKQLGLKAGHLPEAAQVTIDHLGYDLDAAELEGKWRRNLELLRLQVAACPTDAYVRFNLAQTLMLQGEPALAEAELKQALSIGGLPDDIQGAIHNNLAECRLKDGDARGALAACERSLEIVPRQIMAHMYMYRAHRALEDDERALKAIGEVLSLMERGRAWSRVAIEANPARGDVLRAMGHCLQRLGRVVDAKARFLEAAHVEPKHQGGAAGVARCAASLGEFGEALSWVDQALALAPDDLVLMDLRALVLLKRGEMAAAAEQMARMLRLRPGDADLTRRLAGTLAKLGRRDEAVALLAGSAVS